MHGELGRGAGELGAVGAGYHAAGAVVAGNGFDVFVADGGAGGVGGGAAEVVVAAGRVAGFGGGAVRCCS